MIELHSFGEAVTYLEENPGAVIYRYGNPYPRWSKESASHSVDKFTDAIGSRPYYLHLQATNSYGYNNPSPPIPPIFSGDDTIAQNWVFVSKEDWEKEKKAALEAYEKAQQKAIEEYQKYRQTEANTVIKTANPKSLWERFW